MKSITKKLTLGLGLAMACVGCANDPVPENEFGSPPAYTTNERSLEIRRAWRFEGKQIADDFDSIFLLRPPSRLTPWSIY